MTTRYFTFGQSHRHKINDKVFDRDVVVEITADDPRTVMVGLFGQKWSFEYSAPPDSKKFPKGIAKIP